MLNNAIARIKSAPRLLKGVILAIALLSLVVLLMWPHDGSATQVRVGSEPFTLEIADTPAKQAKGLGGRSRLSAHQGMLFAFRQPAVRCFWMKDMHFSIDILWLDATQRIQHIERDVSPATYPHTFCPPVAAQSVIELPAGQAQRSSLYSGQQLHF